MASDDKKSLHYLSVTHVHEPDYMDNKHAFLFFISLDTALPLANVPDRNIKNEEKRMVTQRYIETEGKREGKGDKNLPVEDRLTINHTFLPVYEGVQSATLF